MSEKKIYKICIVGSSLAGGGAERAHSNLSKFFHKKGIEIHSIIFEDRVEYEFWGELFNLGKIKHKTIFEKINRYKKLYDYIKKHRFEYIIDLRYRGSLYGEYILSRIIFSKVKYIPSIRGANFPVYFTHNSFIGKRLFKNAYKIVTVSKEMEKQVRKKYGYQNLKTIYNIVETELITQLSQEEISENIDFQHITALGRMHKHNVKQQDVIIRAYAKSVLPEKGIKLLLVGDGEKRTDFEQLVNDLHLSDKVIFTGFKDNPYPYLKNAKFMVLASKTEGFPNVILESFACGTPVVSYDCKTGPSEMIEHQKNGLLVKDQDIEDLVKSMNMMIENRELYNLCKSNTLKTALEFSPEIIGQQWLDLMNIKP